MSCKFFKLFKFLTVKRRILLFFNILDLENNGPLLLICIPNTSLLSLKKYSLISKLKTTYRYCIKPLLRREIHWEVGGMGTSFYSFDWLTLKVKYFHSDWYFDTWQNKNFYERYIWQDNFRKVKSKFYCHDLGCDSHEIDEDKFWSKVENMEDLYDNES